MKHTLYEKTVARVLRFFDLHDSLCLSKPGGKMIAAHCVVAKSFGTADLAAERGELHKVRHRVGYFLLRIANCRR